jgi:signal peptidase I
MRTFIVCTILVFCFLAIGCKGLAYRSETLNMSPTITQNDMAIANPFAYSSASVERFDLVVIKSPEYVMKRSNQTGDVRWIERVIALPNEKLEIRENKVYINDKLLEEPFEKIIDENDSKKNFGPINIPVNEYFLLGDNRPNSEDGRYWKPFSTIKREDIYSKIIDIKKDFYK